MPFKVSGVSYSGAESENFEADMTSLDDARGIARLLTTQGGFFSAWVQGEGINEQYPMGDQPFLGGYFARTRPDLSLRWVPWEKVQELFKGSYEEWDRDAMKKFRVDSFNSGHVANPVFLNWVEWLPATSWIRF